LRIWETPSGRPVASVRNARDRLNNVIGHRDVNDSAEGAVRSWEAAPARLQATLRGYSGEVRGVALSGDGRLVASGGDDGTVHLWDSASGRLQARVAGHSGGIWDVALIEDGRVL